MKMRFGSHPAQQKQVVLRPFRTFLQEDRKAESFEFIRHQSKKKKAFGPVLSTCGLPLTYVEGFCTKFEDGRLLGKVAPHDAVALQLVVKGLPRNAQRLDRSPDVSAVAAERLADDLGLVALQALRQRASRIRG